MTLNEDVLDRHAQRCTITAMQGCPVCMAWADREMKKASPKTEGVQMTRKKPFRILQSHGGSYVAGIAYQHDSDAARRAAWRRVARRKR